MAHEISQKLMLFGLKDIKKKKIQCRNVFDLCNIM